MGKQNYNLSDEDEDDRKMRHDQVKLMKAREMQSKRARDEKKTNKIKYHGEDDIANDSDYETQRRKKISEMKKLEKQEREKRLAKEYLKDTGTYTDSDQFDSEEDEAQRINVEEQRRNKIYELEKMRQDEKKRKQNKAKEKNKQNEWTYE